MSKSKKDEVKPEIISQPTVEAAPKGTGVITPEKEEPKQPENWTGHASRDYKKD